MKRSEIYRKAARFQETEFGWGFACWSLKHALGLPHHSPTVSRAYMEIATHFAEYYKPRSLEMREGWFTRIPLRQRQGYRVTALCFMAAIAEAEEAATKVDRAKKKRRPLAHAKRVPAVSK